MVVFWFVVWVLVAGMLGLCDCVCITLFRRVVGFTTLFALQYLSRWLTASAFLPHHGVTQRASPPGNRFVDPGGELLLLLRAHLADPVGSGAWKAFKPRRSGPRMCRGLKVQHLHACAGQRIGEASHPGPHTMPTRSDHHGGELHRLVLQSSPAGTTTSGHSFRICREQCHRELVQLAMGHLFRQHGYLSSWSHPARAHGVFWHEEGAIAGLGSCTLPPAPIRHRIWLGANRLRTFHGSPREHLRPGSIGTSFPIIVLPWDSPQWTMPQFFRA